MMLVPRNDFDLFDDIFGDPFFHKMDSKLMKTDIREDKDSYIIDMDLPGFDKKDIKIDITDGYLTINAKTSNENEDKDKHGKYIRKERYYGECSRSFYIGEDVVEDDIKATFKNGILTLEVPKEDIKEKTPEKKYIEIKD